LTVCCQNGKGTTVTSIWGVSKFQFLFGEGLIKMTHCQETQNNKKKFWDALLWTRIHTQALVKAYAKTGGKESWDGNCAQALRWGNMFWRCGQECPLKTFSDILGSKVWTCIGYKWGAKGKVLIILYW
jgi:hypothetical protein